MSEKLTPEAKGQDLKDFAREHGMLPQAGAVQVENQALQVNADGNVGFFADVSGAEAGDVATKPAPEDVPAVTYPEAAAPEPQAGAKPDAGDSFFADMGAVGGFILGGLVAPVLFPATVSARAKGWRNKPGAAAELLRLQQAQAKVGAAPIPLTPAEKALLTAGCFKRAGASGKLKLQQAGLTEEKAPLPQRVFVALPATKEFPTGEMIEAFARADIKDEIAEARKNPDVDPNLTTKDLAQLANTNDLYDRDGGNSEGQDGSANAVLARKHTKVAEPAPRVELTYKPKF